MCNLQFYFNISIDNLGASSNRESSVEDRRLHRWRERDCELDKKAENEEPTNEKQESECVREDLTSNNNPILFCMNRE